MLLSNRGCSMLYNHKLPNHKVIKIFRILLRLQVLPTAKRNSIYKHESSPFPPLPKISRGNSLFLVLRPRLPPDVKCSWPFDNSVCHGLTQRIMGLN